MQLDGIYPAVATPFSNHGVIEFEALEENLRVYYGSRLAGVLLVGSTGEAIHLNGEERLQIVEVGSRLLPDDKRMLVGLAAGSLREASAFARSLERYPISALLAGVPAYFKGRMTAEALSRYYLELADASPFPLLLYNVPQFTSLQIPVKVVAETSSHPKVVGMKESSGDLVYLQEILSHAAPDFQVLMGCAQVLGPSLTLGIRGAILATASAVPDLPVQLLQAFQSGDQIGDLQYKLFRLSQLVTTSYGIPGLKFAMDCLGLQGGFCRLPLLPLDDREKRTIQETLAGLDMAVRYPFRI